jgi:hypothetical protein
MQYLKSNPIVFPLSDEQRAPANAIWSGQSASVDAGPGTGKSHTARAIAKNYNGRVESIPFGRQLADEEIEVYGAFPNITSLNFHRRGNKLLGKVQLNQRKLNELALLLEGLDEETSPDAIAELAGKFKLEAVNCGYEDAMPLDEIAKKYKYGADLIPHAVKLLALSDAKTDEIDFDDMLRFPVLFKRESWLSGLIVLDEVQDYTPHAFLFLIRCLVKKGSQVLMIGDVDQCLQSFAGAKPELFAVMSDYFNCERFQITENRRCSHTVVANAPRMTKAMKALPDAPQGSVSTMAQGEVFDAIMAGEYRNDAVISEANAPLVMFGLSLLIKGIPVQMRTTRLEKLIFRYCPFSLLDTRKVEIGKISWRMRALNAEKDGIDETEANDVANAVESLESYCLAKGLVKTQFRKVGKKFIPIHPILQALNMLCNGKEGITLLTGHTAKGLEWDTVFHLPGKMRAPEQDWEIHQAACLDYVIKTRARLNHITLEVPESVDVEKDVD